MLPLLCGCDAAFQSGKGGYPNRSIELIVPWAAGGGTDRLARYVADALQRRLGQPVIVVNRTGGSGAVGHSAGALAPPNGHTLTMGTFELSTMRAMGISKLTYQNFLPVAQLNGDAAAILVRTDAPWRNLNELLAQIRDQPGKLKMSGTATGGAWDLARSGLLIAANIPVTNVIWAPTQGSAPALVELLGGHVDVVCCSVPEAAAQLEGKQIRVLAVLAPDRLADFPEYPTAQEQGVDYEAIGWRGLLLPKQTPPAIATLLSESLAEIAKSDEFRQFMKKNGFAPVIRGPAEFSRYLQQQETKWRDVIKSAGYETLGYNHDPGPQAMPLLVLILLAGCLVLEAIRSRRSIHNQPGLTATADQRGPQTVARATQNAGSSQLLERPLTPALSPSEGARESEKRAGAVSPGATQADSLRFSADGLFLLTGLVAYLVVMPWIGFVASTLLFSFGLMWRLGTRWWLAIAGSIVMVASIHLLFVTLFKVQLP